MPRSLDKLGLAGQAILIAQLASRLGGHSGTLAHSGGLFLVRRAPDSYPRSRPNQTHTEMNSTSTGETLAKYFSDLRSRADESQALSPASAPSTAPRRKQERGSDWGLAPPARQRCASPRPRRSGVVTGYAGCPPLSLGLNRSVHYPDVAHRLIPPRALSSEGRRPKRDQRSGAIVWSPSISSVSFSAGVRNVPDSKLDTDFRADNNRAFA